MSVRCATHCNHLARIREEVSSATSTSPAINNTIAAPGMAYTWKVDGAGGRIVGGLGTPTITVQWGSSGAGKVGVLGLLTYWRYRHEVCGLRAILFGFKQEAQKVGLPLVVFDHLNHLLREKKHYKYLELGWNLEDNENINRFDAEIGGRPYKRYRIFRKDL